MIDVKLINKQGSEWDISEITSSIALKSSRMGKAGSVSISFIKNALFQAKDFSYSNGDIIRVRIDGVNKFHGYIFEITEGRDEVVKILAYDQIRYFMNTDTYVLKGVTATQVLQRIARDFNLKLGAVANTEYKIAAMVEDGQKLLDIICKAVTITYSSTGRDYCLYDDFGALCLQNVNNYQLDIIIGDGSLMYDYNVKTSIDTDTFNKIKLYKDNKKTGKREIFLAQDSLNIAKWGVLQLYQSISEDMNEAQIKELLDSLSKLKNRETKSLKVSALGDIRVRAGMRVNVLISEYGINQSLMVEECTHNIDGADHTMTLELKVI